MLAPPAEEGSDEQELRPRDIPGVVYLHQTDDMLTRFCYKNTKSGVVEDVSSHADNALMMHIKHYFSLNALLQDLIVFPGDALVLRVDEVPEARVYLFKFKNSTPDRWIFFYMQVSSSL